MVKRRAKRIRKKQVSERFHGNGINEDRSSETLLIAAKFVFHDNREKIKFSVYDTRTPAILSFLKY